MTWTIMAWTFSASGIMFNIEHLELIASYSAVVHPSVLVTVVGQTVKKVHNTNTSVGFIWVWLPSLFLPLDWQADWEGLSNSTSINITSSPPTFVKLCKGDCHHQNLSVTLMIARALISKVSVFSFCKEVYLQTILIIKCVGLHSLA